MTAVFTADKCASAKNNLYKLAAKFMVVIPKVNVVVSKNSADKRLHTHLQELNAKT